MKRNNYVIIFSTKMDQVESLAQMKDVISTFKDVITWNCDMDDEDKILRMVCTADNSVNVHFALSNVGIQNVVLDVFVVQDVAGLYPIAVM